jgi:hypothetical protein
MGIAVWSLHQCANDGGDMSDLAGGLEPVDSGPARTSQATKLLRAAALAAALVPLGSVAAEAVTIDITCQSQGSGCSADYNTLSGIHTWGFYTDTNDLSTLIYMLTIEGTPTSEFTLFAEDVVIAQGPLPLGVESQAEQDFPGATCIPTFDVNQCGLFDVTAFGTVSWLDGYILTITWFPNDNPLSEALLNQGNTTILKAEDFATFTESLLDTLYVAGTTPGSDPGLGGRGNGFSRFAAATTATAVPEPASLLLVGTSLGGFLYRSRRRRRP